MTAACSWLAQYSTGAGRVEAAFIASYFWRWLKAGELEPPLLILPTTIGIFALGSSGGYESDILLTSTGKGWWMTLELRDTSHRLMVSRAHYTALTQAWPLETEPLASSHGHQHRYSLALAP